MFMTCFLRGQGKSVQLCSRRFPPILPCLSSSLMEHISMVPSGQLSSIVCVHHLNYKSMKDSIAASCLQRQATNGAVPILSDFDLAIPISKIAKNPNPNC